MVTHKGQLDENIEHPLKFVHGEVLRADCPNQIARLAAGQHQKQQHDTRDINTYDIMSMMAKVCDRLLQDAPTAFMDDAELFLTLETMGMVTESKLIPSKKPTKKTPHEQLV